MKNKENTLGARLVSLLAVLGVLASILLPTFTQTANAQQTEPSGQYNGMKVHIHKLQADSYANNVPVVNEDGTPIDDFSNIGTNVRPLQGVQFTAYPVANTTTPQDVQDNNYSVDESEGIVLGETDDQGVVIWDVSADTTGSFVVKETGRPDTVSSSIAVPFLIQFPMANSQGQTLKEVHIYPKNLTADLPSIHKAVGTLNGEEKGFTIGEDFNWFLKSTIPSNIGNYEKFEFKDTLPSSLTYKDVEVVLGPNVLDSANDYDLKAPQAGSQGGDITVSLTEAGRNKIQNWISGDTPTLTPISAVNLEGATENAAQTAFIEVRVNTSINTNAVMGQNISNKFTLTFDNTPNNENDPKTELLSNEVFVYTGGKRFIKKNGQGQGLKDAHFHVYQPGESSDGSDDVQLTWTADLIAANQTQAQTHVNIAGDSVTTTDQLVGQPIVLVSGTDGAFDIRGLAYGYTTDPKNPSQEYYLKEIKAPKDYIALQENIKFEVTDASYNTAPADLSVDARDADPQEIVNNKRPIIPATGGIGSLIFILIGLALISFAYRGYKNANA